MNEKKRAQCAVGIVTTGCGGLTGLRAGRRKRCKKGTRRVGGKCRRKK